VDDADKAILKIEEHSKSTQTKGPHVYGKLKTLLEETQGPVAAKVTMAAKECAALSAMGIDETTDTSNHEQVEHLRTRTDDCVHVLNDKLGSLDAVDHRVQSLHEQMRQLSRAVKQFDAEFDTMEPLARDVDYLQSQQRSLDEFDERFARVVDDIGQNKTAMEDLLEALNADQVNALRGQFEHLEEDAASVRRKSARRAEQIRTAINDLTALLQALREAHEQVLAKLDHPVIRDANQTTFTHVRQIRDQQEALRRFRTDLEPLGERVQTLLVKGRDGQRQAAAGVNTAALETATNAVSDSWTELQSRVNRVFRFVFV
jgi:DNA repair exonuclease SbcCD ATPase subunit